MASADPSIEAIGNRYEAARAAFFDVQHSGDDGLFAMLRGGVPGWLEMQTQPAPPNSCAVLVQESSNGSDSVLWELIHLLANCILPHRSIHDER